MKQSTIQIHDARNKKGKGYRVRSVAKNGEILQSSEVLESEKAVNKNIAAMQVLFNSGPMSIEQVLDFTTSQVFTKKGWANEGKKSKKK